MPCRIRDGANPDVMVMSLGTPPVSLAQGTFDSRRDRVRLTGGRVLRDYYRRRLGLRFYAPLDKRRFPLPPTGWCSWYCYYDQVTAADVLANAHWMAGHLAPFGARHCQIDAGWNAGLCQGYDWRRADPRFGGDMATLARDIRAQGLIPGIWLCPQGHSDKEFIDRSNLFVLNERGESPQWIFSGPFTVDPTRPGALDYIAGTLRTLAHQGYRYFKIDGQLELPRFYRRWRKFLHDPRRDPDEAYRDTIRAVRQGIGPGSFLVGCVGYSEAGAGLFDGHRTSHDVDLSYRGFMTAWKATMTGYHLHNVVWYSDPDVVLLRTGLPIDTARAWATMIGITGQMTLSGDSLPDLPPERVHILKRILPAADIRPLDLFPTRRYKSLWDLKVRHLGRDYDVVAAFNARERASATTHIRFADLGLDADADYHVFDFWNREYLGCYRVGVFLPVPPAGCRLLTLVRDRGRPQLLSTSRHITQGWVDLLALREEARGVRGRSAVIAGDPYELRFALPRGFRIARARVGGRPGNVEMRNYCGWATLAWTPRATGSVAWSVAIERFRVPVLTEVGRLWFLGARDAAPGAVNIAWTPMNTPGGYRVTLDRRVLGVAIGEEFRLTGLAHGSWHTVVVQPCAADGRLIDQPQTLKFQVGVTLPQTMYLSELDWETAGNSWYFPRRDRSAAGGQLSVGGRPYARGIGANEECDIAVNLCGLFRRFEAAVGIEDNDGYSARAPEERRGRAVFRVYGDGRLLAESPVIRHGEAARRLAADVRGVQTLRLEVVHAPDREPGLCHANWCEAKVTLCH